MYRKHLRSLVISLGMIVGCMLTGALYFWLSGEFGPLDSVWWSTCTMTTVGYGDITPANDLERMYALFALLVGALVFGYLLSSVGSMISNLDHRSNMVDQRLDQMQEVIRHTDLPPELAARVRSYTEFYFSKQSVRLAASNWTLLHCLP